MEALGRTLHRRCQELSTAAKRADRPDGLTLSIPADRDGRRVSVMLGGRRATLTLASLKVLLQLARARLSTGSVNKIDMGGSADRGFKAISVLRNELKQAYAGDTKGLIANDLHGGYCLAATVSVGELNVDRLEGLDDRQITKLAREIRSLINGKEPSDGKT